MTECVGYRISYEFLGHNELKTADCKDLVLGKPNRITFDDKTGQTIIAFRDRQEKVNLPPYIVYISDGKSITKITVTEKR